MGYIVDLERRIEEMSSGNIDQLISYVMGSDPLITTKDAINIVFNTLKSYAQKNGTRLYWEEVPGGSPVFDTME